MQQRKLPNQKEKRRVAQNIPRTKDQVQKANTRKGKLEKIRIRVEPLARNRRVAKTAAKKDLTKIVVEVVQELRLVEEVAVVDGEVEIDRKAEEVDRKEAEEVVVGGGVGWKMLHASNRAYLDGSEEYCCIPEITKSYT